MDTVFPLWTPSEKTTDHASLGSDIFGMTVPSKATTTLTPFAPPVPETVMSLRLPFGAAVTRVTGANATDTSVDFPPGFSTRIVEATSEATAVRAIWSGRMGTVNRPMAAAFEAGGFVGGPEPE